MSSGGLTRCKHCGAPIRPNDGRFPRRGPWLDDVDWSVCDWTYQKHEPEIDDQEQGC